MEEIASLPLREQADALHDAIIDSLPAEQPCPACKGTGGGTYNDCPLCGGNGVAA